MFYAFFSDSGEKKIAKLNEDKLELMSQLTDMTLVLKEKSRKISDLEIKLNKNDEKYGEVLEQRNKDLELVCFLIFESFQRAT